MSALLTSQSGDYSERLSAAWRRALASIGTQGDCEPAFEFFAKQEMNWEERDLYMRRASSDLGMSPLELHLAVQAWVHQFGPMQSPERELERILEHPFEEYQCALSQFDAGVDESVDELLLLLAVGADLRTARGLSLQICGPGVRFYVPTLKFLGEVMDLDRGELQTRHRFEKWLRDLDKASVASSPNGLVMVEGCPAALQRIYGHFEDPPTVISAYRNSRQVNPATGVHLLKIAADSEELSVRASQMPAETPVQKRAEVRAVWKTLLETGRGIYPDTQIWGLLNRKFPRCLGRDQYLHALLHLVCSHARLWAMHRQTRSCDNGVVVYPQAGDCLRAWALLRDVMHLVETGVDEKERLIITALGQGTTTLRWSVEELSEQTGINPKTLAKRLAELVVDGRVRKEQEGRRGMYSLVAETSASEEFVPPSQDEVDDFYRSSDGAEGAQRLLLPPSEGEAA